MDNSKEPAVTKFHIGKGRYESLVNSRYMDHTYGKDSFAKPGGDNPPDKAHGTYGALLFDKRWQEKRSEILNRDLHRCVICKKEDDLQVHHRQYHYVKALQQFKAPWDYEDHLMITLCGGCHTRGHSKFKVPHVYF